MFPTTLPTSYYRPPPLPNRHFELNTYPTLNKVEADDYECGEEEDDEGDEYEEEEENDIEVSPGFSQNIEKITLDLMVNHKYLAKNNPILVNKRHELHQQLIQHKRDILKIIKDCFHRLETEEKDGTEPLYFNGFF